MTKDGCILVPQSPQFGLRGCIASSNRFISGLVSPCPLLMRGPIMMDLLSIPTGTLFLSKVPSTKGSAED